MRGNESPLLLTESVAMSEAVKTRQFVRRLRLQNRIADAYIALDTAVAGVGGVTIAEGVNEGSSVKIGLGLVLIVGASALACFADNVVRP
jgi:hypothetical protein